ncbi:MAG: serine/threonine protein kinase [Acidobacteria bacterium]|nr:serine/threonine protein kinase [Acidobacteriota bacterium]
MSNSTTKSYYDNLIGKEVKGYLIEKKLGEGGMGAVFKAIRITDKTLIAIKVISPMLLVNSRFVKRFQREAKVGKALAHNNIIQVLEYGETEDGLLFMAMEFVDGETLRALLSNSGPLPTKRAIEIMKQLCEAIDVAHKRGILHRDLKPENVMLTKDANGKEIIKLADFGLVKMMQPDGEITKGSALTEVGEVFGTPHFMPPEQIMGQTVGAPADIYSLGVILYQMLTGKTPFEGSDVRNLLVTKVSQDLPPPSKKFSFINPAYDKIFGTVLARDPENRYKNAMDFYNDFQTTAQQIENGVLPANGLITEKNSPITEKKPVTTFSNEQNNTTVTQAVTAETKSNAMYVIIGAIGLAILAVLIVVLTR